jgi:hypothetical protein
LSDEEVGVWERQATATASKDETRLAGVGADAVGVSFGFEVPTGYGGAARVTSHFIALGSTDHLLPYKYKSSQLEKMTNKIQS